MKKTILIATLMFTAAILSAQNKTALVIGNGQYKNDFSALANPVPEARKMADALESIGFEVIRAYNVQSQDRFYALLEMFENKVKQRGGIALFHYGGHGVQVDGENYLLPTEMAIPDERRARSRGISVSEVTSAIESSGPDTSVIILDACRNNPFGRGGERGLARIKPPRNSLVVYAADAGESARDGLFTPTLLKYLTRSGWSLNQVLQRTRADVLSSSGGRQSPGEYSQLLTDIYLAGASGSASARPNTPSFSLEQSYGSLEVSVQTPGTLYLDGKSMGRIPTGSRARLTDIPAGRHNLEMRYGGKSESKTITVQENRSLAVAFSWVERPDVPDGYVLVEGGTFRMGSPSSEDGRDDDEGPQHSVTVGSFYMKATEVTVGEFRAFVRAEGYESQAERDGGAYVWNGSEWNKDPNANWRNPGFSQTDSSPVTCVSWFDAVEYCNWLSKKEGRTPVYRINGSRVTANWSADGYRLPTEAEWEYAARGGTTTAFHYGNSLNSRQANFNGNYPYGGASKGVYREQTMPVGSFSPNANGLYDMHGNVWEWCWDWYGDYSSGSQRDPSGPSSGSSRVSRGGSWYDGGRRLRSAYRYDYSPGNSGSDLGFRLAFRT